MVGWFVDVDANIELPNQQPQFPRIGNPIGVSQSASAVLMVEPTAFAVDESTAVDNAFQPATESEAPEGFLESAKNEFDSVVASLRTRGIRVESFPGIEDCPDGVFPNNWFSTHEEGTFVLYPMRSETRRAERRPDIIEWLQDRYPDLIDYTFFEARGEFLEGTGSLVLDRINRIAYAARSGRTSVNVVRAWCADLGYTPILFDTEGPGGKPVYHTNVLLSIGTTHAIVCSECIINPAPVLSALLASGRQIIEVTSSQMGSFCANALELSAASDRYVTLSDTAIRALRSDQHEVLKSCVDLLVVSLPTIELVGGGGIRCMLAELF